MVSEHEQAVQRNVQALGADTQLQALTQQWLLAAIGHNYAHNFSWLGRPVIQVPQDIYATQEILWRVQPDLVIETGNVAERMAKLEARRANPSVDLIQMPDFTAL